MECSKNGPHPPSRTKRTGRPIPRDLIAVSLGGFYHDVKPRIVFLCLGLVGWVRNAILRDK